MVRITRLSFDEGMRVDFPERLDPFGDDDDDRDDESRVDEAGAAELDRRRRKKLKRLNPDDRRPDRRQTGDKVKE